jgi:hypothetical protein
MKNRRLLVVLIEFFFIIGYFVLVAFVLFTLKDYINSLFVNISRRFKINKKDCITFFSLILVLLGFFIFSLLIKFIKKINTT